jgi:tetratricopeptide (TPR) repeat protein
MMAGNGSVSYKKTSSLTDLMAKREMTSPVASSTQAGNKGQLVIYCIIFVIGFLAGVAFTVYKGIPLTPAGVADTSEKVGQHTDESQQAIRNLEAEVTAHPGNFQAWANLGNMYYDTDQAEKAIAAYNKFLALHKGDANLLTDLGVMYRKNKQPEKAIEFFNQAIREDVTHLPSRYNKGIVLLYDLNNPEAAIASWEEMLKIDPQAGNTSGMSIRDLINKVKAEQAKAQ